MALRAGHDVRAVVHRSESLAGRKLDPRIEVAEGEMLDRASVERAVAGCDAVIHCVDFPPSRYADHWDALRHVLEALGPRGRLILPGNAWAFGPPQAERITPGHPKKPAGKLASLRADLERAARAENGTVIHLPEVYGPGVRKGICVGIIRRALAGGTAWIPGDLDRRIELLFIDDAARALVAPLGVKRARGAEYTAGGRAPVSPRELAALASGASGRELRVRSLPLGVLRFAWRLHPERRHLQELLYRMETPPLLDADGIRRELGWLAEVDHEEGIRRTVRWFRRTAADPAGSVAGRRLFGLGSLRTRARSSSPTPGPIGEGRRADKDGPQDEEAGEVEGDPEARAHRAWAPHAGSGR